MFDPTRYPLLAKAPDPKALRLLDPAELPALADELRAYLIESVGKSGGHFGAGLGVVELTVALHAAYETPDDLVIWDVGHQAYPHKILTGRRDGIQTVKKKDGIAPFPKRCESEYDAFGVGHSSTSISAALGMSIALAQQGSDRKVVAVIGDGAMTAGMAYEALNHAGGMEPAPNLLVILNDNQMSISENVGGMTRMFGRLSTSKTLHAMRQSGKKLLGGKHSEPGRFVRRWEEHWKGMLVPSTLFEEMGFHYTGPIDGHDLPQLLAALNTLRELPGPQLLHILTTKGKGYDLAEGDQIGYHAVSSFDPDVGLVKKAKKSKTYTNIFSDWLCDMAAADSKLLAITPAMREGSGLVRFSEEYPDRYFDVAIAEQHAVTLAAGMACEGAKPVVAIYSTFLQRAYDQWLHDVVIQDLDVLLAIDRAGVVGPDGATHAGSFDLSYLRCSPNIVLMTPSDEAECRLMLSTGYQHKGPAAVRYPRGSGTGVAAGEHLATIEIGKARITHQGNDTRVALLAFGAPHAVALALAKKHDLTCVDMRFVKPLDEALLSQLAESHDAFITLEDNAIAGGAGSAVGEFFQSIGRNKPITHLGLPDYFQDHASREDLLAEAGLDAASVEQCIKNYLV